MKFAFLLLCIAFHGWANWSVSTYNIRNFDKDPTSGNTDINTLVKIIKEIKSDVMAFEEVVNKEAFDSLVKKALPGYNYEISSCGGFGKQHLAVVYNPKIFSFVKRDEDLSFSGSVNRCGSLRPLFLVTLKNLNSGKNFIFGVVHLKAGGTINAMEQRWVQYEKLKSYATPVRNEALILLGDFNTTGYNIKDQDYFKFESFLSDVEMRSLSEELNCTSYWRGTENVPEYSPSILDHIVIQNDNLLGLVESVEVGGHCSALNCRPATPTELGPSYQSVSDHCPVKVTFK